MEHRKFPRSSRVWMDRSHCRNHSTAEQSYDHMGSAVSGPLVYPTDNVSRGIVHSASEWNSDSRVNVYASSSFSMEGPHLQPPFPVPSYQPFPQSSAAGNMYLCPQYNVDHAHTNYTDSRNIHEDEACLLDSATGCRRRGQLKRQNPGISVACERVGSSRFHSPGSSSSSSELHLEKPPSGYQNTSSGRIGLPHYAGGTLAISGENSLRNVRSRTRLDLDTTPCRTHIPSYSFHHYHATTNLSSYRGAVDPTNIDSDATTHEWSFNSFLRPAPGTSQNSGIMNGLFHERNHVLTRGSVTRTGVCHPNSVPSRNLVPPSQYLDASSIWGSREGRGSHSQREIPSYMTAFSYPWFGCESVSTENGLQSISETHSSRYSRPSTGGWQDSYRNRRLRIDIDRFQPGSSIVDTHDRTGSVDLMMLDHSSLYASSFDQYGDMRLDIDNMGYEDLLVLGERIGSVNTGLTEDMISKCLTETNKSLSQNDAEGNCCICLEEYVNGDEVGSLNKCGHDYHVSCIKKWLAVKNACPICKASVLCSEEE